MDGGGSTDATQRRTRPRTEPRPAEAPPDRFSSLPDALLLHILSFLGIGDAISTALLSRRWRYLWHSVPSLDFSKSWRGMARPSPPPPPRRVVDRVLLLHATPRVDLFRLCMDAQANYIHDSQADAWVLFAVRRGVRVLDLDFLVYDHNYDAWDGDPDYGLPACVFCCGSLEELTLRFCYLRVPNYGVRLGSLTAMDLTRIHFRGDDLKVLLYGCPLLRSLRLRDCNVMRNLNIAAGENRHLKRLEVHEGIYHTSPQGLEMEICAPSLECFRFGGCVARGMYRVKDLSSLVVASFDLDESLERRRDDESEYNDSEDYESQDDDLDVDDCTALVDLLEHICQVQVLKLCSLSLQALSVREMEGFELSSCSNVTSLELSTGLQKWELPGIFSALRACNKLRILNINIQHPKRMKFRERFLDEYDFDETRYLPSRVLHLQNAMEHLETIKIQGVEYKQGHGKAESEEADCTTVIAFIGFLLEVSPALEKLIIQTSADMNKLAKKVGTTLPSFLGFAVFTQSLSRCSGDHQREVKREGLYQVWSRHIYQRAGR